jgi:AcrR family transcriptional regulator
MDTSVVRRPPFGRNPLVGERGTDTQRRILGAALEVFGAVGFAESRVELITERAGCSRPAFYQYFSSKDAVFWVLAGELGQEMVALAERLERVTPDRGGVAHLTDWIGQFMALHEAWSPVFASFQAASRDHQPEVRWLERRRRPHRRGPLRLRAAADVPERHAGEQPRLGADPLQLLRRAHPRGHQRRWSTAWPSSSTAPSKARSRA